jgi:hypothetical protein
MEKVFGGAVLVFWLCCYTHNTKGGEGRQLSTSFRFQQLSLGLHHAGRVCVRGLQEGDELVGVLIGFLGLSFCFGSGSQNYSWLQVLGLLDVIGLVPNNLFFCLYIKERIFVGGRDWVDSIENMCLV